MTRRRVWVTGLAALSTAGDTVDALWDAAMAGVPLTRPFTAGGAASARWSVGSLPFAPGAEVPMSVRRNLDRSGLMLYAAARRAWSDAGLDVAALGDPARAGLVAASSAGTIMTVLDAHARGIGGARAAPRDVLRGTAGFAAALVADHLGVLGPVLQLSGGSVAGACAVGEAWLKVATGQLDLCLAVASEAPLHPALLAQFGAARLLAEGGAEACRPFDRGRRGTQIGEGAVALVLEAEEVAAMRGARSHGRVAGYGSAGDGAHQTIAPHPDGEGLARASAAALAGAELSASDVDLVLLHGTGTTLNDVAEARAFASLFGATGARRRGAAATKPVTGHCLGACGALEAVIALGALARGVVPPTPNLDDPDPALAVPVSREARRVALRVALVNASGFGGRNAALVLERA